MNTSLNAQNIISDSIVTQMVDEKIITVQGGLTLTNLSSRRKLTC
jgi:hypothetical protein